jgi:hypothetical protein
MFTLQFRPRCGLRPGSHPRSLHSADRAGTLGAQSSLRQPFTLTLNRARVEKSFRIEQGTRAGRPLRSPAESAPGLRSAQCQRIYRTVTRDALLTEEFGYRISHFTIERLSYRHPTDAAAG